MLCMACQLSALGLSAFLAASKGIHGAMHLEQIQNCSPLPNMEFEVGWEGPAPSKRKFRSSSENTAPKRGTLQDIEAKLLAAAARREVGTHIPRMGPLAPNAPRLLRVAR